MIIDSSAIVAVLRFEEDHQELLNAIATAEKRMMPAPNFLETVMVLAGSQYPAVLDHLDTFLRRSRIELAPFTADHAIIAREAFVRYGKGRHPAGLSFGDCIAYAIAKRERMPLLFKGDDFRKTDIEPAL